MKWVVLGSRVLLGLGFVVFGLNGFLNFIPAPPPEGPAGEIGLLMFESGWLYVIKAVEVLGGLLVLTGFRLPLGLTLLGPVLFNILVFHLLFMPAGIGAGALLTVLWLVLFVRYRSAFAGILGPTPRDDSI